MIQQYASNTFSLHADIMQNLPHQQSFMNPICKISRCYIHCSSITWKHIC